MGLLDGILGGGARRGMSPLTMALLGLFAYKAMKGKNLSEMLGGKPGEPGALGNIMQGGLGSLLGGLSGGLNDLLKQFQQNGLGDKADSWVTTGQNKPIEPDELERALGEERIAWLMQQTGMSRTELLTGLSRELPQAVDKLTPQGHIPSEEEARRMVA